MQVHIRVNGASHRLDVESRTLLSDLIRDVLHLTGTHRGCDTAQCGACTVHLDGLAVKSCQVLAAQADGCDVVTIEGLSGPAEGMHPMQEAFAECHALQCGYCTPGMVMSAVDLLRRNPDPDETTIRHALEGNLCRCTGYVNIVDAVQRCARRMAAQGA